MGFTSNKTFAKSTDHPSVEIRLRNGETAYMQLYDRSGSDLIQDKGVLWKLPLSGFRFTDDCIERSDITLLALVEGGDDAWNIETIVTFITDGSTFLLLSEDFDVYQSLDGNSGAQYKRFELTLV